MFKNEPLQFNYKMSNKTAGHADTATDRGDRCNTMRVSLGNRFLLGTLGAPAGVLGSGVDGPRRNQLLIAQIMKILEEQEQKHKRRAARVMRWINT